MSGFMIWGLFALVMFAFSQPATGETIQLERQGGTYLVPVLVNDAIRLKFVIDSGASDVAIPADVVTTLFRAGTVKGSDFVGTQTYVLADGSKLPSPRFILHSLRVGDHVVEDVIASVAPVEGELLLGQSFLSKLPSWTIDNSNAVLVLNDQVWESGPTSTTRPAPDKPIDRDALFWQSIKDSSDPTVFHAYLEQFPKGAFVSIARSRLAALQGQKQEGSENKAHSGGSPGGTVIGSAFRWDSFMGSEGWYEFTLTNRSTRSIRKIRYAVVFYGAKGNQIDSFEDVYTGTISANLSRTLGTGISFIETPEQVPQRGSGVAAMTRRVEIRVLDYETLP
jgi:clan AA aspartic protease (TIGR02281 family)